MLDLDVSIIRTDGGTQPRAGLNAEVVEEYAEALSEGAEFPPVSVFYDGESYWLADGFHRLEATKKIGSLSIKADLTQGTRRDAVLHSVGVNATHGLRRSNADKRRAVMTLLNDPEWSLWSDREIAKRCGVSNRFVGNLRRELTPTVNGSQSTRLGTDGRVINTANIGRSRQPEWLPHEHPAEGISPEIIDTDAICAVVIDYVEYLREDQVAALMRAIARCWSVETLLAFRKQDTSSP